MSNTHPLQSHTVADILALIQREARRVTSYDVATLAGVSQSAVSRSFKPGASVSKATHARVMKAASQLDYTPNAAARSLNTRRSNLIALIISDRANLYFPDVLAELSRQFALRGMRILLFTLPSETEIDQVLSEMWHFQVDGVVVAAHLSRAQVAEFSRRRVPFVLYNRQLRDANINAIVCDQLEGARQLVSRLAGFGHRRFAIISGPDDSVIARERMRGSVERLAELRLPAPLIVGGGDDYASGVRGLSEILEQLAGPPDVIICCNDVMAIGCLDSARHEFGLDVPGQLSITGFGGIAPAAWISYGLTTVRQPVQNMAQAAVEMLSTLIDKGSSAPERRVFSATLIEGQTARLGAPL